MTLDNHAPSDFETQAQQTPPENLFVEFWHFLGTNKKWWLLPILTVLFLMGVLVALSASGAAPFIYTLF